MKDELIKTAKTRINPTVLFFFLILPQLKPPYLNYKFVEIGYLVNYLQIFSLLIILGIYFAHFRFSKIISLFGIYYAWLFFVTALHKGPARGMLFTLIPIASLFLLSDYCFTNKKLKPFLSALQLCLELLIYANLICVFVFPNGMYASDPALPEVFSSNWLLGYKNNFITYGLLAFLLAIFQIVRGGNIWRSFALILSMLVSITMVSNATGIAGCAVILIFLLLRLYKYNRICNIVSYSIITVLFFVGVVLLRLQDKLSFVIQNLLNRDLTFSARTFIWDDAIKLIQASPVTGYGILTEEGVFHVLNKMWTHNQILGILFEGGAVGLLLFLIILFIAFRELFLLRNNIYSQILSLFIFVLMIMSQFEYYTTAPMLLFIIFACHIRCFGEQLLTKEEKQQGLQEMNVDCYEIKWESVRDIFKKTWWVIVLSAVLGTVGGCVKAMIESGGGLISIQNHYWTIIKFSGAVTLLAILIVWVICYRKNSRIIKA